MRIGIGVTTFNRPECLKECLEHIEKHSPLDGSCIVYVATDTDEDRRGVAFRKNECLRVLQDCDYVFLFDDDCFPIKDGWIDFFINSGEEHLLYLNKSHNRKYSKRINNGHVDLYNDCGGVFMFMTKAAIEKVGAFDEQFELYGFEHADYSNRILGKANEYPCLNGTEKYIFAHDYSTKDHKSSITDYEKNIYVTKNWNKYFGNRNKSIYLPL